MAEGEPKHLEDLIENLAEYEIAFLKIMNVFRRMGLSDNVEEAIIEVNLLIEIVKAHHKYLLYKKKLLEHADSS